MGLINSQEMTQKNMQFHENAQKHSSGALMTLARCLAAHQEQLGVQHLAQGHCNVQLEDLGIEPLTFRLADDRIYCHSRPESGLHI